MTFPSTARPRRAFSLLEVLVAMSVLSVLLLILLSMTNGASKLWRENENRVDSYREARAALNMIASDLASLHASTNTAFFAVTPSSRDNSDDSDMPPMGQARTHEEKDDHMNGRIFFLTALPADAQESGRNKSDLCEVGYFLAYDKTSLTGKGSHSYNLYRSFRSSDDTFNDLKNSDGLKNLAPDTSPTASNTEVLARNITGFEVKPYTINADPSKLEDFTKSAQTPLPDMLEITIKAISNESAKRFGPDDKAAWEDTGSLIRNQSERAFTTRVYLPAAAQVKAATSPSPSPTP
jgi:prepilin-type N-terminal cleavage/methylation domain-containing protein